VVRVSAAIILDHRDRALMVRKRGTATFMQPGGKPEPGESPVDTVRRELAEELGLRLTDDDLTPLGRYVAPAANEPGRLVDADVFRSLVRAPEVAAGAEIEEVRWIGPQDLGRLPIAPLSTDCLLPLVWPSLR